jgi:hypothetical protein
MSVRTLLFQERFSRTRDRRIEFGAVDGERLIHGDKLPCQ